MSRVSKEKRNELEAFWRMHIQGWADKIPATAAPVVIERSAAGIEIDLKGGRRVRFDRETEAPLKGWRPPARGKVVEFFASKKG